MNPDKPKTLSDDKRGREFEKTLRDFQRESTWTALRIGFCCLCWILSGVLMTAWLGAEVHTVPALGLTLITLILGLAAIPPFQSKVLRRLQDFHDVRAIPPLLEAMELAHGEKAGTFRETLTDLLPRLRPADTALLTRRHVRQLWQTLEIGDPDQHFPYLQAIVLALEHVGDEDTARRLKQFIERGAVTPAQQQLCVDAQYAWAGLTARLEQQRTGATLLRPAASENDDELLRSASPTTETLAETLLHTSDAPPGTGR
jgi:hypothetical protein